MRFIREMIARKKNAPSNNLGKKSSLGKEMPPQTPEIKAVPGNSSDEIVLRTVTSVANDGAAAMANVGSLRAQGDVHLAPPANGGGAPKDIWDIDLDADEDPLPVTKAAAPVERPLIATPDRSAGSARPRSNRVKTRLLGFEHADGSNDVFEQTVKTDKVASVKDPVGWIVVTEGPGRGTAFTLMSGMSQIGRGDDQPIQLNFGDATISRANHASIAYDSESHEFFLGHGGKSNLVRLNAKPVLSTEPLKSDDLIRIGETTLRLIVLCDKNFNWDEDKSQQDNDGGEADDMAIA